MWQGTKNQKYIRNRHKCRLDLDHLLYRIGKIVSNNVKRKNGK